MEVMGIGGRLYLASDELGTEVVTVVLLTEPCLRMREIIYKFHSVAIL